MLRTAKQLRARRRAVRGRRSTRRVEGWPPAPGDLCLLQEFVNTVDFGIGTDELASPSDLADWLASRGLLGEEIELTEADRERTILFRDSLRAMLDTRDQLRREVRAALEWVTSTVRFRIRFGHRGETRMEPVGEGLDRAIGHLVVFMCEAQNDGWWARLDLCANPACRAVFYDDSAGHDATWCRPRCGGRIRFAGLRPRRTRSVELPEDDDFDDPDDY